jgi:hypothetical protein
MNTRASSIIVFILTALLFAGCSKEPQPSKSDIEQSLTTQLPAFARISSLSVDAMQNLGTKVEPAWQSRFRATIKVSSDTFAPDGMDSAVTFVRPVKRDGETTEIFGKSLSRLYAGAWRTSLEFDGQPIPALGMPESAFAPKKVIVRGSKAETDYLAAAQREAEERRAAETRAAEAQRVAQAQQEENNRIAREREQEGQRAYDAGTEAFKRGFYPEGVSEYEKSVKFGNANALNQLAWHFATCKDPKQHDGKRAVELALQATKIQPQNAGWLDTLAAAYARNGQFDQAITTQIRALSMQGIFGISGGEERLKLYRQQKAYSEESQQEAPKPMTHERSIEEIKEALARGEKITSEEYEKYTTYLINGNKGVSPKD